MTTSQESSTAARSTIVVAAIAFAGIFSAASALRWAGFQYHTFDLAFYVQGVWQLIHGRFHISLIGVPLLGNHVEPVVFGLAPIFALFRHPLTFVVVQNVALASMAPVGLRIARTLGLTNKQAALSASTLLLAPATGYVALHEFHPEALAAPLILLMIGARLENRPGPHWIWFLCVLACKENMALLLIAYCVVHLLLHRRQSLAQLRRWYVWPMLVAIAWFAICTTAITPALNRSAIDYGALYDRLGNSAGDVMLNTLVHPQRIAVVLWTSLSGGNLLPGLLLPFLALPLLRPRWMIIATPVLLQHLLSWRSSEWTINFHYAAPLIPLFWIAAVEATSLLLTRFASLPAIGLLPSLIVGCCFAGQLQLGPAASVVEDARDYFAEMSANRFKTNLVSTIPPGTSVVASLPYLSHLAEREQLYSLHHILKGLKTLSRSAYEPPPPTDFVLIDYGDSSTFDPSSGYFHPAMRTVNGQVIPSSEQLLHDFLRRAPWEVTSYDSLTLMKRTALARPEENSSTQPIRTIGTHTQLLDARISGDLLDEQHSLAIKTTWRFQGARSVFPWMMLRFVPAESGKLFVISLGICAPEASEGIYRQSWQVTTHAGIQPGNYTVEAFLVDRSRQVWAEAHGEKLPDNGILANPLPLGSARVVKATAP